MTDLPPLQSIAEGTHLFTEIERLMLLNQYRILAAVDPDGGWERDVTILQNGYTARYRQLTEYIYDEMPEDDCRFVEDVLSMFDALQRPFVPARPPVPVPADFEFHGFDGNNEVSELGYARFLIEKEGRWGYLEPGKGHALNSHFPTLDLYRRMLDEWNKRGRKNNLSGDDLDAIKAARIHPENR